METTGAPPAAEPHDATTASRMTREQSRANTR